MSRPVLQKDKLMQLIANDKIFEAFHHLKQYISLENPAEFQLMLHVFLFAFVSAIQAKNQEQIRQLLHVEESQFLKNSERLALSLFAWSVNINSNKGWEQHSLGEHKEALLTLCEETFKIWKSGVATRLIEMKNELNLDEVYQDLIRFANSIGKQTIAKEDATPVGTSSSADNTNNNSQYITIEKMAQGYIVYGDTKLFKEKLKELKGRWESHAKCWCFSAAALAQLQTIPHAMNVKEEYQEKKGEIRVSQMNSGLFVYGDTMPYKMELQKIKESASGTWMSSLNCWVFPRTETSKLKAINGVDVLFDVEPEESDSEGEEEETETAISDPSDNDFKKKRDVVTAMFFNLVNRTVFESKLPKVNIVWKDITSIRNPYSLACKDNTYEMKFYGTLVNNEKKLKLTLAHAMCTLAEYCIDQKTFPYSHTTEFTKWADLCNSKLSKELHPDLVTPTLYLDTPTTTLLCNTCGRIRQYVRHPVKGKCRKKNCKGTLEPASEKSVNIRKRKREQQGNRARVEAILRKEDLISNDAKRARMGEAP